MSPKGNRAGPWAEGVTLTGLGWARGPKQALGKWVPLRRLFADGGSYFLLGG